MAGLIGLAPAASAAPTCPTDYELVGDTCVQQFPATWVDGDFYCPEDAISGPTEDEDGSWWCTVPNGTKTEETTDITSTATCPDGGVLENGKCRMPNPNTYYSCPEGQETGHPDAATCYRFQCPVVYSSDDEVEADNACTRQWVAQGPATLKYRDCPRGWENDNNKTMCKKSPVTVRTCPTPADPAWSGPFSRYVEEDSVSTSGDDHKVYYCTREVPQTKEVPAWQYKGKWTCPEDSDGPIWPDDEYVYDEYVNEEVTPYCERTTTPGDDTPQTSSLPVTYYAEATASGTVDLCLADGASGTTVSYSGYAKGSGITPNDAGYVANTEAVKAAMADLASKTPEGATTGSCGAPAQATPTVVTNAVQAATVAQPAPAKAAKPAGVSAPAKATLPAAVPAGDGSQAPGLPLWAVALAVVGLLGAGFSARSWAASRK